MRPLARSSSLQASSTESLISLFESVAKITCEVALLLQPMQCVVTALQPTSQSVTVQAIETWLQAVERGEKFDMVGLFLKVWGYRGARCCKSEFAPLPCEWESEFA